VKKQKRPRNNDKRPERLGPNATQHGAAPQIVTVRCHQERNPTRDGRHVAEGFKSMHAEDHKF